MPVEQLTAEPTSIAEAKPGLQDNFDEFYGGLRLACALEKRYSCKVLGVEESQLQDIAGNFDYENLRDMTDKLNALFYGRTEQSARYDDIIDQAIALNGDSGEASEALSNPDMLGLAKNLARAGLLFELNSNMLDISSRKHAGHLHSRRKHNTGDRPKNPVKRSEKVKQLIGFNHLIRDLVDSQTAGQLRLDRKRAHKLIKTILLGNERAAGIVESGVALEVAAKRLLSSQIGRLFGRSVVDYGDVEQDSKGGDIVVSTPHRGDILIDVKKFAPSEVREAMGRDLDDEPGYFWRSPQHIFLWLGPERKIDNEYRLPQEFAQVSHQLINEIFAQPAVA
ncbi:MAG TPA: hypothetical protein VMT23_03555 [Candidatus Binatia bacterium]|nr:hypothetical protein [Candidatus Binatia bacterium]